VGGCCFTLDSGSPIVVGNKLRGNDSCVRALDLKNDIVITIEPLRGSGKCWVDVVHGFRPIGLHPRLFIFDP